jgi:hypothetical protein
VSDPILGPAWPALLAPGLRVVGLDGDVTYLGTLLREPSGAWLVAWDDQPDDPCAQDALDVADLRIDYAHPATRDAVCRALEAVFRGDVATTCPPLDWLMSYPTRSMPRYAAIADAYDAAQPGPPRNRGPLRLRDVAAAVWGGE